MSDDPEFERALLEKNAARARRWLMTTLMVFVAYPAAGLDTADLWVRATALILVVVSMILAYEFNSRVTKAIDDKFWHPLKPLPPPEQD